MQLPRHVRCPALTILWPELRSFLFQSCDLQDCKAAELRPSNKQASHGSNFINPARRHDCRILANNTKSCTEHDLTTLINSFVISTRIRDQTSRPSGCRRFPDPAIFNLGSFPQHHQNAFSQRRTAISHSHVEQQPQLRHVQSGPQLSCCRHYKRLPHLPHRSLLQSLQ